jgi:uncharacterized protein YeaO (DUF488 family)
MAIRIVRLGSDRAADEGARLGTVRHPPRGVKKQDYAKLDYFDTWLPELAPSAELVRWFHAQPEITPAKWNRYTRSYRREMSRPSASRLLDALALLSRTASFSVGCYCENEERCHRSLLRQLLAERGADISAS